MHSLDELGHSREKFEECLTGGLLQKLENVDFV